MKRLCKCFQAWPWMLNLGAAKHFHLHLCSWPPLCHKRVHVPKREIGKKFHSRKRVSKYPVKIPSLSDPSCDGISETMDWWLVIHTKGRLGNAWLPQGAAQCCMTVVQCPVLPSVLPESNSWPRVKVQSELPRDIPVCCSYSRLGKCKGLLIKKKKAAWHFQGQDGFG